MFVLGTVLKSASSTLLPITLQANGTATPQATPYSERDGADESGFSGSARYRVRIKGRCGIQAG